MEDQIQVAPVFGCSRALAGPVRIIIQVIGHLRRPEARNVAVVYIALNRLAKTRGTSG